MFILYRHQCIEETFCFFFNYHFNNNKLIWKRLTYFWLQYINIVFYFEKLNICAFYRKLQTIIYHYNPSSKLLFFVPIRKPYLVTLEL